MKVHIERDLPMDQVHIYLYTHDHTLQAGGIWVVRDPNERPEPTFTLQWDAYEALAHAIQAEPLPSGSQTVLAQAWADAVATRDRLLAIVERT